MKDAQPTRPEKEGIRTALAFACGRFFVIAILAYALGGCNSSNENLPEQVYEGPIRYMVDENTLMTDSGKAVIRIKSSKRLDFKSGDQEWPEGLLLSLYSKSGLLKSTFEADMVHYSKVDHLYRGEGNVIVKNYQTDDELNTEELFWDPSEKRFFTDKFVTITSDGEVHTGEGLDAEETFETYTILAPSGTLTLEDEP